MTSENPFTLTGKTALVTGGNGGIGKGIAIGLAKAGANVVIVARNEAKSTAVVAEIESINSRSLALQCDVLVQEDLKKTVSTIQERFGRLDILVNNAGINRRATWDQLSEEDWDSVLETNLKSVFLLSRLAHPLLKADGGGKVINIGSMTSIFGTSRALAYSASKGGIVQLTKSLAISWAQDNIQVNAILPGWIRTDLTAPLIANDDFSDRIIHRTPQGRWGDPEELAGAAVFLASPASNFITGQSLSVDGGYSIF